MAEKDAPKPDLKAEPEKIETPKPEEILSVRPAEPKASSGAASPIEIAAAQAPLDESHAKYGHAILTDAQIDDRRTAAEAKLFKEQQESALKAIETEHLQKLRMERGMVVGGRNDDMVTITLDLAEHSACLMTNGRPYWHGATYTVPRHVADDLRSRMFMGWRHQNDIDGKSLSQFYQRHRNTTVSPKGVTGAPSL